MNHLIMPCDHSSTYFVLVFVIWLCDHNAASFTFEFRKHCMGILWCLVLFSSENSIVL